MNAQRAVGRLCFVFLLCAALPCAAWAQAPAEPAAPAIIDESSIDLGFAEADKAKVAALIKQLGSLEYDEREAATQALSAIGPGAFAALAEAFRATDDYEVRLRIEKIVREQFLWHTLYKHYGFLGIQYVPSPIRRSPGGLLAIRVTGVQPGTAAVSLLLPGDRIIAVDGRHLPDDASEDDFPTIIQEKGAGGKVTLAVIRGGDIKQVEVTLQARPLRYYADQRNPELMDKLNRQIQAFAIWWNRFFGPSRKPEPRLPSHDLFELPVIGRTGPSGR